MRRRAGIDDVEPRDAIRTLSVGDHVKLTLLSDRSAAGQTVAVRITYLRGNVFRGVLASRVTAAGLPKLRAGTLLNFGRQHIHSLAKRQSNYDA